MTILVRLLARLLALAACLPFAAAMAADFDGSRLLICAAGEAWDCVSGEQCDRGLPADFGLPVFLRVDVARKTVVGPYRTTEVQVVEKGEGQILLQGTELAYAWTLALNTADGTMVGSVVNSEGVYAVFGSCTPQ